MAQSALAKQRPMYEVPKARRYAANAPRLYYPKDAIPLRTSFRDSVLQTIYEFAQKELGNALKSVVISTWNSHDEPVPPILLLTFWTDADKNERLRAEGMIIEAVIEESMDWSDAQRKDYAETIYFGVEPINV